MTGLAFKASVAPFHQWTPDVYEGAPTPVTAFMAVATKAAAFGVILRIFNVALIGESNMWAPALAVLAVITIVVGNVGAIGQSSLKRLLAYSSVAQAGLHARRRRRHDAARRRGRRLLPVRVPADEHGRVRRHRRARARDGAGRRHHVALRAGRGPAGAGLADDDRDALARRLPGDRGVLRQDLPDRRRGRQRLRLARRRDRARLGDLARLLPAGRGRGVDALARRGARRGRSRRRRRRGRRSPAAPRRPTPTPKRPPLPNGSRAPAPAWAPVASCSRR